MHSDEIIKMTAMLSKIAYELHDKKGIDENLSEMLLDFWREFNYCEDWAKEL